MSTEIEFNKMNQQFGQPPPPHGYHAGPPPPSTQSMHFNGNPSVRRINRMHFRCGSCLNE